MGAAADARGQVPSAACGIEGADARRWVDSRGFKMVGEGGQYILCYYNLPRIYPETCLCSIKVCTSGRKSRPKPIGVRNFLLQDRSGIIDISDWRKVSEIMQVNPASAGPVPTVVDE
jgi:hypothetical protein